VRGGYLREHDLQLRWHSLVDIAVTAKATLSAVAVAVALFSLVIETAQYFLPTRYSSILDVAADTVGGILGGWLELHTGRDARSQPS
jgi:VanZ family protein